MSEKQDPSIPKDYYKLMVDLKKLVYEKPKPVKRKYVRKKKRRKRRR